LGSGAAFALQAITAAPLSLREGPGTGYTKILTMPGGAQVSVDGCSEGWCAVTWDGASGFAAQSGLLVRTTRSDALEPEVWPIFPPYPYRSGHYPKADWYDKMPPYVAIKPWFYRKRFFMMAQERHRYRYMPHIFSGSSYIYDQDGGGPIAEIDTQQIGQDLQEDYKP
jgi:hypothetical protein